MLMLNAYGRRLEVGNEYLKAQTFQFGLAKPGRGRKVQLKPCPGIKLTYFPNNNNLQEHRLEMDTPNGIVPTQLALPPPHM